MDTVLITAPTIWDGNKNIKQNGNEIAIDAIKEKEELRKYLDAGFTVKTITSFVFNDVVYIHYVLERESKDSADAFEAKLQKAKDLLQTLINNAPNNYIGNVEHAQAKLSKWLQTVADADTFCKEN